MTIEVAKEKLYTEWQKFLEDNIDYAGVSEAYKMAFKALEQNVKLKKAIEKIDEWVHSGNRGNCDYFIVDQIEEIINGLKKNGTVSE
jgi:hypothetical protein